MTLVYLSVVPVINVASLAVREGEYQDLLESSRSFLFRIHVLATSTSCLLRAVNYLDIIKSWGIALETKFVVIFLCSGESSLLKHLKIVEN